MAATENTTSEASEPDADASSHPRSSTGTFGVAVAVSVPASESSVEMTPLSTVSSVLRRITPSILPKVKVKQLKRMVSLHVLGAPGSGATQSIDGVEQTPYGDSSVSSNALQDMPGLGQTNVIGSGAGRESSDPVYKEDEEELSESPRYGDEVQGEGSDTMASANMKDTPEYQFGEMASDVKHLQEDTRNLRGDVKELRGDVTEGFKGIHQKLDNYQTAQHSSWWNLRNSLIVAAFTGIVGFILAKVI